MSGLSLTIVIVVAVVVIALVWLALSARARSGRSRELRSGFGREYDVAVDEMGSRRAAEAELEHRRERHDELPLRELSPESRARYAAEWEAVQARFVDRPMSAVAEADELIRSVMVDRGYRAESFDQQVADLSVEHGQVLDSYRAAHATVTGNPSAMSTEDLRAAMVDYRRLFADLVGTGTGGARAAAVDEDAGRP